LVVNGATISVTSGSSNDQLFDFKNDTSYLVSYTASASGVANILLYANGKAGLVTVSGGINSVVVATQIVSSAAADTLRVNGLSNGTVSNISVREILSADVWQDSAGTIPATIGSTVGLLTDRSFGGELGGELAPDLSLYANGTLINTVPKWSINSTPVVADVQSGGVRVTADSAGDAAALTIATVAGRSYSISSIYSGTGTSSLYALNANASLTTNGHFVATGAVEIIYFRPNGNAGSGTGTWANISVRELRGNHATQSTAGNRPVMAEYNSKPILSFNGTSQSMQLATNPIGPTLSQPYTIIVGGVVGALGTARRVCGDLARWVSITADGGVAFTNAGSPVQVSNLLSAGQPFVIEATWNGTTAIVRLNGVVIISSALAAPTGVTPGAFFVGQNGANTLFHAGLLLPVFATNSVVTEAQRRQIARGMAQKLGVTYA
jgi:hypothetical protein